MSPKQQIIEELQLALTHIRNLPEEADVSLPGGITIFVDVPTFRLLFHNTQVSIDEEGHAEATLGKQRFCCCHFSQPLVKQRTESV